MRKLIAAINMTLDGFCDHTSGVPDDQIHYYYKDLLNSAGAVIYGRKTYQLMEFWLELLKNPSGNNALDEFAVAIDRVPKIVFSRTLEQVNWATARVAKHDLQEEISALKQQEGKPVLVGSPSLIVALLNLDVLDELQVCIHPVIAGYGLPLFKNINDRWMLKLLNTKVFEGGAVIHYYKPEKKSIL